MEDDGIDSTVTMQECIFLFFPISEQNKALHAFHLGVKTCAFT